VPPPSLSPHSHTPFYGLPANEFQVAAVVSLCWCRFVTYSITFQIVLTLLNVPVGVINPDQLVAKEAPKSHQGDFKN
jgi:hypothetical protein